jgi:cytochrome c oxidase subunit 1
VTIHNMRAPGMSLSRMPLFVWTILIYSYLILLAISSFAATLAMLLVDRNFNGTFFDPTQNGAPLLWQHLFWFMGHPEVYIMALPGFGIISEIIPVFSRKPIFGYRAIVVATGAIAFLGMLVWAHHMFATPLTTPVLSFFMLSSFAIAVPTGIKIFNWLATLWRGNIEFRVPLLFAVGMIAQFVVGGATGVILAVFPVDWQLTDTYFVVAHMHFVLFGGIFFALVGGLYYWFPKMTGRMMSETWGKVSFVLMVIGFNLTFLPQHSAGMSGMPRRVFEYSDTGSLHSYNLVSTIGSFILAAAVLVTVANAIVSVRRGRRSGPDPWRANTLEWFTTSPPPAHNFDVIPTVRSFEPMKDIRRRVREREALPPAPAPEREREPEPVG